MNWIDIKIKQPIAYESGCWDGLRSDKLLVRTMGDKYHVVMMYEGTLDGSYFCDFYDENDYEIKNVTHWLEIELIY